MFGTKRLLSLVDWCNDSSVDASIGLSGIVEVLLDDPIEHLWVTSAVPRITGKNACDRSKPTNPRAGDLQSHNGRLAVPAVFLGDRTKVFPTFSHRLGRSTFGGFLVRTEDNGERRTPQSELFSLLACGSLVVAWLSMVAHFSFWSRYFCCAFNVDSHYGLFMMLLSRLILIIFRTISR
jgi:hypothetical protein